MGLHEADSREKLIGGRENNICRDRDDRKYGKFENLCLSVLREHSMCVKKSRIIDSRIGMETSLGWVLCGRYAI